MNKALLTSALACLHAAFILCLCFYMAVVKGETAKADAAITDPTRPLGAVARTYTNNTDGEDKALTVQGIFIKDSGATALINGKAFKVGQSINGFYISNIQQNYVQFKSDHTEHTLYLYHSLQQSRKVEQ